MKLEPKDKKCAIRWLKSKSDKASRQFAPLYKSLNWTWGTDTKPPTQKEIKQNIDCLISEIENDEDMYNIGTGGITVKAMVEDGSIIASIEFKKSLKWFNGVSND